MSDNNVWGFLKNFSLINVSISFISAGLFDYFVLNALNFQTFIISVLCFIGFYYFLDKMVYRPIEKLIKSIFNYFKHKSQLKKQEEHNLSIFEKLPDQQKSILWTLYIEKEHTYSIYDKNVISLVKNRYIRAIHEIDNNQVLCNLQVYVEKYLSEQNLSTYTKLYNDLSEEELKIIGMFFEIANEDIYNHQNFSYEMTTSIKTLEAKNILDFNVFKYKDIKLNKRFQKVIEDIRSDKLQRNKIELDSKKMIKEDPSQEAKHRRDELNNIRKIARI